MARFQRGYGYDYDHHPSTGGYRGRIGGYRGTIGGFRGAEWGRGYGSRVPAAGYRGKLWEYGFDRDRPERTDYERRGGYDRGYAGTHARYDRGYGDFSEGYRSRAQTDAGDPYGDRQSGTPIRMIRERDNSWSGWGGRDRAYGYDRDYRATRRARGYDVGGGWFW